MVSQTRRDFLKLGLAAAASAAAASGIEIPLFGNQNSSLQSQLSSANTQVTNLKNRINTVTGFVSLSVSEQTLVEAIVETIIPSDSSGPGAKEAGVIYFIDRQLAADYGQSANMFRDAPHIPTKLPANGITPLMVNPSLAWAFLPSTYGGTGYSPAGGGGFSTPRSYTGDSTHGITASPRVGSGINYQYSLNLREFWRVGLAALEKYASAAYGGSFESLSAANQLKCLQDVWGNLPTTNYATADDLTGFSNIIPADFAYEVTFMTWAGFLMDPLYGGNQNMVGWAYTGFNGVNFGNFYGEGLDQKSLMVATTPTRLTPASLAQYQQKASGGA
jgi:hypothetical protein